MSFYFSIYSIFFKIYYFDFLSVYNIYTNILKINFIENAFYSNKVSIVLQTLALISSTSIILIPNPVHAVFFLILTFINIAALLFMMQMEFLGFVLLIIYVGAIAVLFLFIVMMLNIKITKYSFKFFLNEIPIFGIILILFFTVIIASILKNEIWDLTPLKNKLLYYFYYLDLEKEDLISYLNFYNFDLNLVENYIFFIKENTYNFSLDYSFIFNRYEILNLYNHNLYFNTSLQALPNNIDNTVALGIFLYSKYMYEFLLGGLILLIAMIGAIILTLEHKKDLKRQYVFHQISRDRKNSIFLIH